MTRPATTDEDPSILEVDVTDITCNQNTAAPYKSQ